MPIGAKILIGVGGVICVVCLVAMIKSGHFFKSFFVSLLSGVGSLFAVNLLSDMTGVGIAVNWYTTVFCALSGMCGSITLVIADILGR